MKNICVAITLLVVIISTCDVSLKGSKINEPRKL